MRSLRGKPERGRDINLPSQDLVSIFSYTILCKTIGYISGRELKKFDVGYSSAMVPLFLTARTLISATYGERGGIS